jgi:phosphatidylserine/phosphatidylglycerophosphate/cardiolipin synthase-like enzyme
MVRDSEVAFVSGFNMKGDDWDTISHDVFDPRRMPFDATEDERRAVLNKEEFPSFVPRKDYGVRIQGPAVADIEDIFEVRWTRAIDDGDYWSEYATPFIPSSPLPEPPDGVPSQVQVTMPAALAERSILDSHLKSIAQAEELLFIEDQYFRSPILVEALVARMLVAPDLHVVVVTKTVPLWDPSTKFTWQADRQLRDLFPDRYSLYQLATMDATVDEGWIWDGVTFHFAEMYLHSKLRIVDDRYFSVGSCNWNNRGYLYEGELNFTLLDADFASQARADAFADMVGPAFADELDGTVEGDLDVLRRAAEYNEGVRIWWEENASSLTADELDSSRAAHWPSGTIYPWSLDGYLVEVGPDVF